MTPTHFLSHIGVGATSELSLRVSVATLVRVLLEHPENGHSMLALERKATLLEHASGPAVRVIAQPFGGAVRIHDWRPLQEQIRDFHFDSEESRTEQDFRIFIRPSAWETVQEFCSRRLTKPDDPVLETDPRRELAEEFEGVLQIGLMPDQYNLKPVGMVVEESPAPTDNIHAQGFLTARIYRLFEARILDASLSRAMVSNSEGFSNRDLHQLALEDARSGGKGWANAILTLSRKRLRDAYLALFPEARNSSLLFENNQLDESVGAVLKDVYIPRYRRL